MFFYDDEYADMLLWFFLQDFYYVQAKEAAPGSEIDGRPIRVDYSITKRAHTPTPGVYLGRPM